VGAVNTSGTKVSDGGTVGGLRLLQAGDERVTEGGCIGVRYTFTVEGQEPAQGCNEGGDATRGEDGKEHSEVGHLQRPPSSCRSWRSSVSSRVTRRWSHRSNAQNTAAIAVMAMTALTATAGRKR
jgi:hypothetical protein